MCRLLRVSRSGFYAWQQRPPSAREMANRRLSKEIRTIHHEVNGIYGHRRIKAELAAMGKVALESIRLDLTRSLEDK
ncbi:IS3 family transposase [Pseudomonas aeruginosa]|uniref:IS3 family transposase n=2 Tax=Pseudomonas aeruginosa TaxID=287 RepID=UPI00333E2B55